MSELVIYSASELGSCTKYLVCKRLGFEVPAKFGEDVAIFQRGHQVEQEVLAWLQDVQGYQITSTQPEYYIPMGKGGTGEDIVLRCHPDALGITPTHTPTVIEIKSAADDVYNEFKQKGWEYARGLFPRYRYQISAYHHATNLPLTFVVRNVETGATLINYEDSIPPLYALSYLRVRIESVEQLVDNYDIPDACDYPNFLCPLSYLHEDVREFEVNEELDNLAREYDDLRAWKKKNQGKADAQRLLIRKKILKAMEIDPSTDQVKKSIDTGNVKVSAQWMPTSYPAPNWEKMRQDGIDVEKYKMDQRWGYRVNVWVRGRSKGKGKLEDGD